MNSELGTDSSGRGEDPLAPCTQWGVQPLGQVWAGPGWLRTLPLRVSADFCCSRILDMVKQVDQLSLGIFHPAFAPIEYIKQQLQADLPADIHILASQQLGISLTRWPDGHNIIVTDFASRDEVIQVSRWWDPRPGGR